MSTVVKALFYLRVMSFRNALRSRLQRLRQPKYMIGAIAGVAYLYLIVFRNIERQQRQTAAFPVEQLPTAVAMLALLLMVFVALYWAWPRSRAALAFTQAEIAFLFPAPIRRRTLIHHRLVSAQVRLLLSSAIIGALSGGWVIFHGNAAIRILGCWLIFATLSLHTIGSSFVITRLLDHGMTSRRRQYMTLSVIAIVVALAAGWIWGTWRDVAAADLDSIGALFNQFASLVSEPPVSWLLAPAKWLIQPVLAPDWPAFVRALGPALLIYAAHYLWVLRSEVSFEEASIAKAEKRAARVAAMRAGNLQVGRTAPKAKRPAFKLSPNHRPEIAFVWKNLLASAEYLRPRNALIAAAIIVVGCSWITNGDHEGLRTSVAMFSIILSAYALIFGPMIARQDLRRDLPNADILKTYPLHGWQVVLGEILTPVAIVTVVLWLLLLAASLTFRPPFMQSVTTGMRIGATLGIALLAPLLCAIQILVMNAAALLFPAWIQLGPGRAAGIDVMGQRILFLAGALITIVFALLPSVLIAAVVAGIANWIAGPFVAAAAAVVTMCMTLCIEIGLAVLWLGGRFEAFDLSAELRA